MKKINIGLMFIFALSLFTGCIKNDIPYPKIKAAITGIEVRGQISAAIDESARTVKFEMADSVDLSRVRLMRFEVSNDAVVTPEPEAYIDLSSPLTYTLTTYQDYTWTLSASQTINRYIMMENQVGEAIIDADAKLILVSVAGNQDLFNTKILDIKLGPQGETITPDPYSVTDFSLPVKFVSTFRGEPVTWMIRVVKSKVSVSTGEANAFAKYAIVTGNCNSGGTAPYFQYRVAGQTIWTDYNDVTGDGGSFTASLEGLVPQTEYEFRAAQDGNYGEVKSFTTEAAPTVPNLDFDNWIMDGKSWFPNADLTDANYIWDSGNRGANSLSAKNPTSPEEVFTVKGKAAKLASSTVLSVLAAGSIYTGKYVKTVGVGAELAFGIPFTGRPRALKGYYNYTPAKIDKVREPYLHLEGKNDQCHIYIVLADWGKTFTINTTTKTLLDLDNDPGIIAVGDLLDDTATGDKYKEFEISLNYKSLTRKPTHILIVAAASRYGDYFTGGNGTVLYVDEFELVY